MVCWKFTIAYLVVRGAKDAAESSSKGEGQTLDAELALLVFAAVHVYRTRNQSEPPKWMGKLQEAKPELMDRQRNRDRALHRHRNQQPGERVGASRSMSSSRVGPEAKRIERVPARQNRDG